MASPATAVGPDQSARPRVHVTLFIPGTSRNFEAWQHAVSEKGLTLRDGVLAGDSLPFTTGVEWVENPRDGSFGKAFSFGTASAAEQRAIESAGGAVVLTLPVDLHRERADIARLVEALTSCGALAVRIEESKLGYPAGQWVDLVGGEDPWALYRATVVLLDGARAGATCGMQVFSLPDAQVAYDGTLDAQAGNLLLGQFNVYQLSEDPVLVTGATFSPTAEAPARALQRWPDDRYPASHPCHNPFGIWRLGAGGRKGAPVDELALVFVPALVAVLLAAQEKAGRPLTRDEVEETTRKATCIAMNIRDAQELERSRGYADLDPEFVWEQWRLVSKS